MKTDKLFTRQEAQNQPVYHELNKILKALLLAQQASNESIKFHEWKYFTQFQIEILKAQIGLVRALQFLDPWEEAWNIGEKSANELIAILESEDAWKQ